MSRIISAQDFTSEHANIGFSINRESSARALRKLADAIEAGDAVPQKATVVAEACQEQFALSTISVSFVEFSPEGSERRKKFEQEQRKQLD